jgi:hypothetical protein
METHEKGDPLVALSEQRIKVACVQLEPRVGENAANIALSCEKIGEAAELGEPDRVYRRAKSLEGKS